MIFRTWILDNKINEDTPIGDLARDIKREGSFPKSNSHDRLLGHLYTKGACHECIEAFEEAYEEFKTIQRKIKETNKNKKIKEKMKYI